VIPGDSLLLRVLLPLLRRRRRLLRLRLRLLPRRTAPFGFQVRSSGVMPCTKDPSEVEGGRATTWAQGARGCRLLGAGSLCPTCFLAPLRGRSPPPL